MRETLLVSVQDKIGEGMRRQLRRLMSQRWTRPRVLNSLEGLE